jgi:hypothetical protein
MPGCQYAVREKILEKFKTKSIFHKAKLDDGKTWEDVIDEAVIEQNNWLMYGSRKENEKFACELHACIEFSKGGKEVSFKTPIDNKRKDGTFQYPQQTPRNNPQQHRV